MAIRGEPSLESLRPSQSDVWSDWLLHRRHGDDDEYLKVVQSAVLGITDRVLDGLQLEPGMTLLDVGAGEGVLAFRALKRMADNIKVVLTDVSVPMLEHAREMADKSGVGTLCDFVECSAEQLSGIRDSTIDAVTTRASLAYVSNKAAALGEFYRVLKPGGRLSIGEPILQDEAFIARALRIRVEAQTLPATDPFLPLLHRWKASQFPDTEQEFAKSALVNFSERDLVNLARAASFGTIHLELHIDVTPSQIKAWQIFLDTSPHPWAPSLRSVLTKQFSQKEQDLFEATMRPIVEAGKSFTVDRMAYLTATKPLLME
jgi:arsenite methyltransferase